MRGAEHKPTQEERLNVAILRGTGATLETIAYIVSLSIDTLNKHYVDELARGKAIAVASLGNQLYMRGMKGDTTAAIFWLKTRGGKAWSQNEEGPKESDKGVREQTTAELRALTAKAARDLRLLGGASGPKRSKRKSRKAS